GEILDKLVAAAPKDPEVRRDLAGSKHGLGDLYRDTDAKKAEVFYQEALKQRRTLVKQFPSVPIFTLELANSLNHFALLLQRGNRNADAATAFNDALALYKHVTDDYPHLPDYAKHLAVCLVNRANLFITTNSPEKGEV